MYKPLTIAFFILAVATTVYASTPPNSPQQLTPTHNASWSDTQAIAPGNITFTWKDNGDPEGTPLWFYFYLIKWNSALKKWEIHTTSYASAQGVTTYASSLMTGYYAWQVAAVDATKSSDPWHRWADLNGDSQVTVADWSFLVVKQVTSTVPPADCSTSPCFYISPTGSDTNNGTSPSTPWKTFNKAIPQLDPGEILVLMDGTWTDRSSCSGQATPCLANTKVLEINCSAGAKNGTQSKFITVQAQNERKARIADNGVNGALRLDNCQYWRVQGIYFESQDDSSSQGLSSSNDIGAIRNSHNNRIERNVFNKTNRFCNCSGLGLGQGSDNNTMGENELYNFHRNGFSTFGNDAVGNRWIRNYANKRNWQDVCANTECFEGPNDGYVHYGSMGTLTLNNIVEDSGNNFGEWGIDNIIKGNISIRGNTGFNSVQHAKGYVNASSKNPYYENNVAVNNSANAFFARSAVDVVMKNNTSISAGKDGVAADDSRDLGGDPRVPGISIANHLSIGNDGYGFKLLDAANFTSKVLEYSHSWNNDAGNYSGGWNIVNFPPNPPGNANPQLGTCYVYIPNNSPFKGKGKNGGDIGANIIFRYDENGNLTNQKLWNQNNGAFPCGATVSGLNDVAGGSCFDVHKRLNVGVNGCPIP